MATTAGQDTVVEGIAKSAQHHNQLAISVELDCLAKQAIALRSLHGSVFVFGGLKDINEYLSETVITNNDIAANWTYVCLCTWRTVIYGWQTVIYGWCYWRTVMAVTVMATKVLCIRTGGARQPRHFCSIGHDRHLGRG